MSTLIVWVLAFVLYFLPLIIAANRGHANQRSIGVLNLLLGWTVIGWIVALIWSFSAQQPASAVTYDDAGLPAPAPVRTCPYCAEEIQHAAIRCKHCHADLTTSQNK